MRAVVGGEAEFVFSSVGLIGADPEVELVGPLPAEVQTYAQIAVGVSANAKSADAARGFVQFVTDRAALPVLKSTGVERDG